MARKKRYRVVVDHAANDTAAMLMTITPAQIEVLQRQWDKVNRRYVSEYRLDRGAEEQRQARDRRLFSRIREWTGNLSPEQEKKIIALADTSEVAIVFYRLRHEDRLRRQHEFLQLMTQRGDAARFQARLSPLSDQLGGRPQSRIRQAVREWERKQGDVYARAGAHADAGAAGHRAETAAGLHGCLHGPVEAAGGDGPLSVMVNG